MTNHRKVSNNIRGIHSKTDFEEVVVRNWNSEGAVKWNVDVGVWKKLSERRIYLAATGSP